MDAPDTREWLEADGLGGFASGTVSGLRTRRYHALLLTAATPPTGRLVLVNGCEVWVATEGGPVPLSTQRYAPNVINPDGHSRIESFEPHPWPRWRFRVGRGVDVVQEITAEHGTGEVGVSWRLQSCGVTESLMLCVRPLLSGRDYHALHRENGAFRFDPQEGRRDGLASWTWRPYDGIPGIVIASNAVYEHEPVWYRNFLYQAEQERGLDCIEDLAAPGIFRWDLSAGDAIFRLSADAVAPARPARITMPAAPWPPAAERTRRAEFPTPLHRAADAYLVRRGAGRSIVAGYPWFTDWGRDTFIALRGLCLATGRLQEAGAILLEWAGAVSEGMLPNRFPDRGETPEYNAVDASLWYAVAVHDYLAACAQRRIVMAAAARRRLRDAIAAILCAYVKGTRHAIRMDDDGLVAAGEPGVQLTWMDAKAGTHVVTPRIGKPVEVQALWLAALRIGAGLKLPGHDWKRLFDRARQSFLQRFWNEAEGCLYDVVDADHRPGAVDPSFRPNQIFAVGGLPWACLEGERATRVVDAVERDLWTPMGLRSLSPRDPRYVGRYIGSVFERDGAYHQGTVWPWLIGPFVEAWVRTRGGTAAATAEARSRFLTPVLQHLEDAGVGHVSEIADGDPPQTPRGCPFQAWSMGEVLRLQLEVLA